MNVEGQSVIDKYDINLKTKYGEGGYGATYAAKHKAAGEELAVKLIDTHKMALSAISRETNILMQLKHGNIIDMKDHGHGHGQMRHIYFIFMELASGGELFDQVIDRGASAMPEPVARGFFNQMLSALRTCHLWGVAHRDLKLENVLLNSDGVVKLIDFGLSHIYPRAKDKSIDRSKPLFDVCGSKSYAAPEVLGVDKRYGTGYDGFVADAWSLGVCLFAMVSGFFPLDEASNSDWRYTKLRDEQARNPQASTTNFVYKFYKRNTAHLSRELVHLLDNLLLIDPTKRLTLEQVAEHPWVKELKLEGENYDVSADDYPVYRGALNVGPAMDYEMNDDDEMPVYRSLGGAMGGDDGGFAMMPTLARQTGNINLLLGETGIIGEDFA
jgi:MAP/microtubule affinity-regulating kinase